MNPKTTDLLAALALNRWRLDCRHETGHYRVMFWCKSCGLWRCVVDTGEWFPGPVEAIVAASKANAAS